MGAAQEDSVQGAEAQSQEPQLKVRSSRPSAVPGWMARILDQSAVAGEIETPAGTVVRVGHGAPLFRVRFRRNDLMSRPQDEFSLGRAYVNGEIDLEGDMLALLEARSQLADRFRLWHWLRSAIDLLSPATRVNKKVIDAHYTLGNDFYLSFLDSRYRFYSQCLFASDDEPLEDAAEHKLETTFRALRLRPRHAPAGHRSRLGWDFSILLSKRRSYDRTDLVRRFLQLHFQSYHAPAPPGPDLVA